MGPQAKDLTGKDKVCGGTVDITAQIKGEIEALQDHSVIKDQKEIVHPVNIVELVMTNADQDITQVTEALEEDIAVQKAQAAALLMMTLQATAQVTVSLHLC